MHLHCHIYAVSFLVYDCKWVVCFIVYFCKGVTVRHCLFSSPKTLKFLFQGVPKKFPETIKVFKVAHHYRIFFFFLTTDCLSKWRNGNLNHKEKLEFHIQILKLFCKKTKQCWCIYANMQIFCSFSSRLHLIAFDSFRNIVIFLLFKTVIAAFISNQSNIYARSNTEVLFVL